MPSLAEQFADRTTRQRAAEIALVAHGVLYPEQFLLERRSLRLSPAAAAALDLILEWPSAVRAGLLPVARFAHVLIAADLDEDTRKDLLELASEVDAVGVVELAEVGTLPVILAEFEVDRMQPRNLIPRRYAA